jgi:3-phenylpropionate/trans-cinnamate dioxygenase ferredoxin subunit
MEHMAYVKVAKVDELTSGSMKKVTANGKELLLANIGGSFYAMDNRCSHMKGDLSTGILSNNIVTCPRHGSQFDVTNAKCLQGPKIAFVKMKGKDLSAYETKVEGQDLLVNL